MDFDGIQAGVFHPETELLVDFSETVLLEAIAHAQASARTGPIAMLIGVYFGEDLKSGRFGHTFVCWIMIQVKRVYDEPAKSDGMRFLVERLWPRGLKKEDAKLDGWLREAAPSTELRKWFSHDPDKWHEFQRRYKVELAAHADACKPILDAAKKGRVTLLFSSHNAEHNNVVALKAYLEGRLKK